jgi:hypothetical protein
LGGKDCISGLHIVLVWEVWFWGVLVNHCRGHRVTGGFGHGGQDSWRYPRAREMDKMLLDGWVVSLFGQGLVKVVGWAKQKARQCGRLDNHINRN